MTTTSAVSASAPSPHKAQCFTRDQVGGIARHDAHSAWVQVDNDRYFPLQAVGECAFLKGDSSWPKVARSALISRDRIWFCTGDTADLLPANHTGMGRCPVTLGHEVSSH